MIGSWLCEHRGAACFIGRAGAGRARRTNGEANHHRCYRHPPERTSNASGLVGVIGSVTVSAELDAGGFVGSALKGLGRLATGEAKRNP